MERALKAVERMERAGDADAALEMERLIAKALGVSMDPRDYYPDEAPEQELCQA